MSAESIRKTFLIFLKAMKSCYGNECLNQIPSEVDLKEMKLRTLLVGFLVALEHLIVCNCTGRTVRRHGKISTEIRNLENWQLFR